MNEVMCFFLDNCVKMIEIFYYALFLDYRNQID